MGRRLLIVGALLSALSAARAEPSGQVGQAPETVSALTQVELQCFEGPAPDPSDARPLVAVVLSPRMVLSLLEWPGMAREAQALGFRVRAWRDPRVPEAEWLSALSSDVFSTIAAPAPAPLPPDCTALWMPMDHLPFVRVMRNGYLHPWPMWGVMTPEAWRASLLNRLGALQRASVRSGAP